MVRPAGHMGGRADKPVYTTGGRDWDVRRTLNEWSQARWPDPTAQELVQALRHLLAGGLALGSRFRDGFGLALEYADNTGEWRTWLAERAIRKWLAGAESGAPHHPIPADPEPTPEQAELGDGA